MKKFILLLSLLLIGNCSIAAEPIEILHDDGIYHIILHGEKIKKKIKFVSSEGLITNREAHQKTKAKLTVNAGYFDPENGKSISYIVADSITSEDPRFNENLLKNPILRKNLENYFFFFLLSCFLNSFVFRYLLLSIQR